MPLLGRYLFRRMLGPSLTAVVLLCGLVWLLQALRLGHHLLGAGGGAVLAAKLLLLSAPPLLVFSLPIGLASGILFALIRLRATGQLEAMQAAGASPLRLAAPGFGLSAMAAVVALLAVLIEPLALRALETSLSQAAARALVLAVRPGFFHAFESSSGQVVIHSRRRLPSPPDEGRIAGVMLALEQHPAGAVGPENGVTAPAVLLARQATLRPRPGCAAEVQLEDGELQMRGTGGGLRRIRFRHLAFRLELWPALSRHLAFIGARARSDGRVIAAPFAAVGLGALALAIGLAGRGGRLALAIKGIAVVTGWQVAVVVTEGTWAGGGGVALLAALATAAALGRLIRP